MKVVVDDKIPYIQEALRAIADEVLFIPGSKISSDIVHDADALIVRTRTKCDRNLLEGSRVQFIATATIGYDHIDTEYCSNAGIIWKNAPGSNSSSVAQYIESVFILLEKEYGEKLSESTLGVIGVGNVGSKVALLGEKYGMRVLLNDPPRSDSEGREHYCSLEQIAEECDIITFHTPLFTAGEYKSLHLADDIFFRSLKKKPVLINTSRGEVIDTVALLSALTHKIVSYAVIDVWENEPDINRELLSTGIITTPHIAGYSADGKANATRMSLNSLCEHFGIKAHYTITPPVPDHSVIQAASYEDALLEIYDPRKDSIALKQHPAMFEKLRGDYPLRREKKAYKIIIS